MSNSHLIFADGSQRLVNCDIDPYWPGESISVSCHDTHCKAGPIAIQFDIDIDI